MDRRLFVLLSAGSVWAHGTPAWAQQAARPQAGTPWREQWTQDLGELERQSGGRLGVSALDTGTGLALGWREDERFAMCSTFKTLLAGWMLWLVDRGRASLTQRYTYPESAVVTYSPISGPQAGKAGLTLAQLCAATVSWSDNTAANVLLERHGGPAALTAFLHEVGDSVSRLDRVEPDLNSVPPGDTRDTTTPLAMLNTTRALVLGDVLRCESRAHLKYWLLDGRTGDRRLRAGAPGWEVGDKTGTWEPDGMANDVAVMWPPDQGAPLLISCFLERGRGDGAARDAVVAEVARKVLAARTRFKVS
jgi:beta-lactamase class A